MELRYLLDTNAVLDFLGNNFSKNAQNTMASVVDKEINLSVINKIELLGFSKVEQILVDFVSYANILNISNEVVDKTIEIRKIYKTKLPDAIIAATAIVNGLILISHNTKDFKNIDNLQLLDIHAL